MRRKMTVIRAPGSEHNPCIRITNKYLENAGFYLGDIVSVTYKPKEIVIKKIKLNDHE